VTASTSSLDRHGQFDFTDGPTELPGPWSPPPDPDFLTGTIPQLERADLAAGHEVGIEPSDSIQATTRLSREEVQSLLALRAQARELRALALAPSPAADAPRPAAANPPPAAEHSPPVVEPRSAAMTVPPPAVRLVVAYRWQLHHVAIAFALGVLTGVLAMR
jgi:hypothetical protein